MATSPNWPWLTITWLYFSYLLETIQYYCVQQLVTYCHINYLANTKTTQDAIVDNYLIFNLGMFNTP